MYSSSGRDSDSGEDKDKVGGDRRGVKPERSLSKRSFSTSVEKTSMCNNILGVMVAYE